jgi:hypothetical protein
MCVMRRESLAGFADGTHEESEEKNTKASEVAEG